MTIDSDILARADKFAYEALQFVRTTTGDPSLESVSQWSSLVNALAAPIQRLRNLATKKVALAQEYNQKER